jgi:hypothetical protein
MHACGGWEGVGRGDVGGIKVQQGNNRVQKGGKAGERQDMAGARTGATWRGPVREMGEGSCFELVREEGREDRGEGHPEPSEPASAKTTEGNMRLRGVV